MDLVAFIYLSSLFPLSPPTDIGVFKKAPFGRKE